MNFTESEISALLDAHDALVRAYLDTSLAFDEFVSAYGDFQNNYALVGDSGTADQRAVFLLFQRRIAFHLRVAGVLSGLRAADDPADISHDDANRFLPAVGLMRIRALVGRYPDFKAEADFGSGLIGGQTQFQGAQNGQLIEEAHTVVPLVLTFSADGKVSGTSRDNGCDLLCVCGDINR